MTRERRAHLGLLLGALLTAVGAGLAWGPGYALLIAGLLSLAWFLVLYDVPDDGEDVT